MLSFNQVVGERLLYEQRVVEDTISSADWSCDPSGLTISALPITDTTKSQALISSVNVGIFVVTAKLTLASGQVRKGQVQLEIFRVSP